MKTLMLMVLALILGYMILDRHPAAEAIAPPSLVVQIDSPADTAPALRPRVAGDDREEADGLPVPIVPGTRVTEAKILPPEADGAMIVAPKAARAPSILRRRIASRAPFPSTIRSIPGRLSATVERARDDARLQLEREVAEWLTPEVPTSWKPPAHLITPMIRKADVQPIVKDYGTLYETTLEADFSPYFRDQILAAHHREVVAQRLGSLGGILGFVLVCLAALAGYIRADEATKGYYTYWLRAIAAAGIGASGVLIYQILT